MTQILMVEWESGIAVIGCTYATEMQGSTLFSLFLAKGTFQSVTSDTQFTRQCMQEPNGVPASGKTVVAKRERINWLLSTFKEADGNSDKRR